MKTIQERIDEYRDDLRLEDAYSRESSVFGYEAGLNEMLRDICGWLVEIGNEDTAFAIEREFKLAHTK